MQEQQKVENVWVNRNSSAENYGAPEFTPVFLVVEFMYAQSLVFRVSVL
jgi:hypothetical protein